MIKVNGPAGKVELSGSVATIVAEFGVGLRAFLDQAAKDGPDTFRYAVKVSANMIAYVLADAQADHGIDVDLAEPAQEKKAKFSIDFSEIKKEDD